MNKDTVAAKQEISVIRNSLSVLDTALGGYVSSVISAVSSIYQGRIEAKFENLILDVLSGGVTQNELDEFIQKASKEEREFISNIVLKNIQSDNRLTTFLLARLLIQEMKNGKLTSYEQSFLTNINIFSAMDYELLLKIIKLAKRNENQVYFVQDGNDYIETVISKFKSVGVLKESHDIYIGSSLAKSFMKTEYTNQFLNYLIEFFKNVHPE